MKIRNNQPIHGQITEKIRKKDTSGVFQSLFHSELSAAEDVNNVPDPTRQTDHESTNQHTWQALQNSIDLLDQAMRYLESGENAPDQLLQDIEALRSEVQHQSATDPTSSDLQKADTILAVEAARIRALNH